MKELTIEQKAKAYDEAVIRGSRLWESDTITRENYEYIFPELKESEDERVRKFIIKIFKDSQRDGCSEVIMPEQYDKIFAWLEKQKGNDKEIPNSAWSEEDEERLDSIIESYKDLLRDYKACHDADYIPYNSDTLIRNVVDDVNFLKSLKIRYTWKPSDEQMDALNLAIGEANSVDTAAGDDAAEILTSLYEQLKKLKG